MGYLTRHNRALRQLSDPFFGDIDRFFEPFLESAFNQRVSEQFAPAADIEETQQGYLLSFDLPGLSKEQVQIDVSDNILTVSGERKTEADRNSDGFRRYERSFGRFERSFRLPKHTEPESIKAQFKNGVLNIYIDKVDVNKHKHKVEIRDDDEGGFFSRLLGTKDKTEH